MKNFVLLLFMFVLSLAQAATISDNKLNLGNGTTTGNKELIFDHGAGTTNKRVKLNSSTLALESDVNTFKMGDGASSDKTLQFNDGAVNSTLKFESSTSEIESSANLRAPKLMVGTSTNEIRVSGGNLEFSNDGALYKKIGSGSGNGSGGINIFVNSSFEDGLTSWTNSGGTFTQQTYTNSIEGETKFARFVASGSGQYVETSLTAVPDFLGAGCQVQVEKYATATDGAWKISVLDASANVLATQNFNNSGGASTFIATPLLSFACPAAAATFKLRIESLAAATIDFDRGYGGGNKNTVDIAQSRIAGVAYIAGTTNCASWTRTNTALGALASDADCPGPTIVQSSIGEWQTTDSDLPRFSVNNLPKGKYKATIIGAQSTSSSATIGATIFDGTNSCTSMAVSNTTAVDQFTITCIFEYSAAGNRAFELYMGSSTATVTVTNQNSYSNLKFTLEYFPVDSQTAVTSDQSGWFIDANIGGANPSMGIADVASYAEITNASLDLVLNSGSAPAKIPCSATNASTGLTCAAGSESVGLTFTPAVTGRHRVCAYFTNIIDVSTGSVNPSFELVETTASTQTIIQEGNSRISSYSINGDNYFPNTNCGIFNFTSISEKTIRLFYEQLTSGTVVSSAIIADRLATVGQRDIHFIVEPVTANQARPVLTGDQLTTPSTVKPVLYSAKIGGADTVTDEIGDFINGDCTNATTGYQTCVFNSGKFVGVPNCTATAGPIGGSYQFANIQAISSSSVTIEVLRTDSNIGINQATILFCHGLAP